MCVHVYCECVCALFIPSRLFCFVLFAVSFLFSLFLSVTLTKIWNAAFCGIFYIIPGLMVATDYGQCRRVRVAGGAYQRRKDPLISVTLWEK